MKQLNLLFFLLFSITAFAQSIEFAPPGATWQYWYEYSSSTGGVESELRILKYTEDTEIDGISCKKLTGDGTYYVYQVDKKVYYRQANDTAFYLMWDFGVQPGESFVSTYYHLGQASTYTFTCTSHETTIINGEELPVIVLEYTSDFGFSTKLLSVNPRFGPMDVSGNYIPFLHPGNPCCGVIEGAYDLCAYRDNTLGTYEISCELVSSTTETWRTDISLAPNPANDYVTLQLPADLSGEVFTAQLTDITGRVIATQTVTAPASTMLLPAGSPKGMYLLQIMSENTRFAPQKLLLNGE